VSLILDALKKLERERDSREPGVLVVGSVPWGESRRSRRPLAGGFLALAAFALLAWWWWRPTPHPASATHAPTPSPVQASSPSASARSGEIAPTTSAAPPPARRLAVPTFDEAGRPPVPAEGAAPVTRRAPDDLRLNAITLRDGRPVALINDHLVMEGDSFDGVKILHIGEAEVEVEVRGQRRVLRF
jgi:hypothetical protein